MLHISNTVSYHVLHRWMIIDIVDIYTLTVNAPQDYFKV